jgi:hypothetical protein
VKYVLESLRWASSSQAGDLAMQWTVWSGRSDVGRTSGGAFLSRAGRSGCMPEREVFSSSYLRGSARKIRSRCRLVGGCRIGCGMGEEQMRVISSRAHPRGVRVGNDDGRTTRRHGEHDLRSCTSLTLIPTDLPRSAFRLELFCRISLLTF